MRWESLFDRARDRVNQITTCIMACGAVKTARRAARDAIAHPIQI
jgi:hypothetical protein